MSDLSVPKIRVQIETAKVERIFANAWNPNRQSEFIYQRELESIRTHGFIDPLLVREIPEGFEIIDGEHRWKASRDLGLAEIPVNNLGTVSDSVAKQLTIIMNETRGRPERTALSRLLQDVAKEVSREDLYRILPLEQKAIDELIDPAIDWEKVSAAIPKRTEAEGEWKEVSLNLDTTVADRFEEQLDRFKAELHPGEKLSKVSPVQALEALAAHLGNTPDEALRIPASGK
jgi:ParB-like chromosome segregation protein Spo0J